MARHSTRPTMFSALAAAVALAPLVGTAAHSAAAVSKASATAVAPRGHHPATEGTLLDLLAGSPRYVVYGLGEQLAGGAHVGDTPPAISSERLFARTKSGRAIHLGRAPKGLQPDMSLSGSMLTGVALKPDFGGLRGAFWWDLATGKSGKFTLPGGYMYRSAAPHGAVVSKGRNLFTLSTTGKRHALGAPFPDQAGLQVTAADHGFVVLPFATQGMTTPQSLAYMPFTQPGHYTKLQTSGTLPIICPSLGNVAAGCVAEEDSEGSIAQVELIPVDGSAPTATSDGDPSADVAVAGKTLMWSSSSGLQSIRLGDSTVRTGPDRFQATERLREISGSDPYADIHGFSRLGVPAYGHAVFTHHTGATQLELAKSVDNAKVIFTRPPSAASLSSFYLAPGRVSYIDDQKRHHGHGLFSTYTAKVSTSPHGVALGRSRLVRGHTDYRLVGVSKPVKVYSTNPTNSEEHSNLTVVYKGKRHTIKHVPFDGYLRVSGTRVMFPTDRNLQSPGSSAIYDAATGKTTVVKTHSSCCDPYGTDDEVNHRTPTLAGHMVFYFKPNGAVVQHDLTNGHERTLSDPVSHFRSGIVFAGGKYVAWRMKHDMPGTRINAYRNVATMSKAVSVKGQIFGVSNAGVLIAPRGLTTATGQVGFTARFDLLRFGGKRHTVIKQQNEYVLPQLAGSAVAWVNIDGLLRVRSVR